MIPITAFRSETPFTQRSFRRWLSGRPAYDVNLYELLNRHIVQSPPASWTHSRVGARLVRFFEEHVSARRSGLVFESSAGYDLPSGDTVEPDVSYVSTERLRTRPPTGPNEFLRVVPNLVVEILSPATAKRDLTEKKAIYERNGVQEYWVVDSGRKTITVFRLTAGGFDAGHVVVRGVVKSSVLPKLRISVAKLFAS